VYQKARHNVLEQVRRKKLRDVYDALKKELVASSVPLPQKVSNVLLMKLAAVHIGQQTLYQSQLEAAIEHERTLNQQHLERNQRLRERNAAAIADFRRRGIGLGKGGTPQRLRGNTPKAPKWSTTPRILQQIMRAPGWCH
jgi:hypothetical protein